jgi:hypothetical protein
MQSLRKELALRAAELSCPLDAENLLWVLGPAKTFTGCCPNNNSFDGSFIRFMQSEKGFG